MVKLYHISLAVLGLDIVGGPGGGDCCVRAAYLTARVLMDPQTTMSTQMQILKGLTV